MFQKSCRSVHAWPCTPPREFGLFLLRHTWDRPPRSLDQKCVFLCNIPPPCPCQWLASESVTLNWRISSFFLWALHCKMSSSFSSFRGLFHQEILKFHLFFRSWSFAWLYPFSRPIQLGSVQGFPVTLQCTVVELVAFHETHPSSTGIHRSCGTPIYM